jgi:hypothetical protein
MSQTPGGNPGQQPWGGAPQPDPRLTPGQGSPGGGQGYPPGYGTQPGYVQPGYGSQPGYGPQPGYGAQPPGYAPQPQPYATQPVYGQQPQPYAPVPYQPTPARSTPGSPVLGFIALTVVALAAIGTFAGGWVMLQETQAFLDGSVYTGSTDSDALQQAIIGPITAVGAAAMIGFAGWIAGIIAAATNRGRVAAILAIVVGVAAPLLIWGYVALSFAAMVQQYR